MFNENLHIVILAAGTGRRMYTEIPKVMHLIGGKYTVQHVIDVAVQLVDARCIHIVYGFHIKPLIHNLKKKSAFFDFILQESPLGTGHAVQKVLPILKDSENVLVLYGDVPLITYQTLIKLLSIKPKSGIGLLTAKVPNPSGYGRILRKFGKVVKIVEDVDIHAHQYCIKEINTGILVATSGDLKRWLSKVTNNNKQKEFYLTDIIALAWEEGSIINTIRPNHVSEIKGINNKLQLTQIERLYQKRQAERLSLAGVIFADTNRFDLRGDLLHGVDVFIDSNVIIEGKVSLGNRVVVGAGCILKNSIVEDDVTILPYTIANGARLKRKSMIGPFARLRPKSKIGSCSKIGNFVEIKNSSVDKCSKVNHLSYIGDADIGVMVNVGAGAITCNYDGICKHKTIIKDGAFIGSDSQLIAPVTIGKRAIVGAGTTVTEDVLENETVISRIKQLVINKKT